VRVEVLLVLAVCVASVALLAAPGLAGAAPSATTIKARAQSGTITWGTQTIVTGTLMDVQSITALGGLWLRVEWSPTGSPSSWTLLSTVTTENEAQYATGQYAQVVQPRSLTYYRFVFLGNGAYAASVSNTLTIAVRPYLGRPAVPEVVKKDESFRLWGTLRPRFPAGEKTVRVKVFLSRGGKWVLVKRLAARNVDTARYSKYRLTTSLAEKGQYRFRAYTRAMDGWAPAQSRFSRVLVVK
jgi:hypothetical protein